MDINLLILFILLNVANVIIQTVKSLATIKCGKGMAALVNAIAYGLYTVVLVYTVCDLPLMLKVAVVAACNLVGVFVVKWGEEKSRKAKLWKVEATVPFERYESLDYDLTNHFIEHNYILLGEKYAVFNIYCPTQEQSKFAKKILDGHKAKYFVSESKTL
jgi:uncharacterized protein YebE (UPF0316 family)